MSSLLRREFARTLSITLSQAIGVVAFLIFTLAVPVHAAPIAFVQANSATPQIAQSVVTVPFTAAQTLGNLNVVVVGWNDSTATVNSVVDSSGNVYAIAAAPVIQAGTASQAIYYAKNIFAATAGANTVTVTFSVAASFADIRIAEYSGLDTVSPLDVAVGAQGNSAASDSGLAAISGTNDLLIGANLVQSTSTAAGTGFTSRVLTTDGDILEDRIVAVAGSYSATVALDKIQPWIMQMVAFKAPPAALSPSITSLSPVTGPVGTLVTITGTNFGATQGTNTVTFNGTSGAPTSWTSTNIVVPVPPAATTGNVAVTVGGIASNGINFTVGAVSSITFVQTNSAAPQATVSPVAIPYLSAQTAGNLNVVVVGWNDSTATVASVTDSVGNSYSLAAAPIVQTATASQAIYYAKNIASAAAGANTVTVSFNVAARHPDIRIAEYSGLDALSPLDTSVGAQGNTATSDSGPASTTNANDLLVGANTLQSTTLSAGTGFTSRGITTDGDILEDRTVAATGSYNATANLDKVQLWIMQLVAFRAAVSGGTPVPNIASLSPVSGNAGTAVTIRGSNFGAIQGTSTVSFNGVLAAPTSWTATTIIVPVPGTATSGSVVVTVGTTASNSINFTVIPTPSITSLTPASGSVSTSITIAGTNFGATQGTSTVTFNGVSAIPTAWAASSITVPVPAGAITGNVVVTVGGIASNGLLFTVTTPAPSITSLTPNSGPVGTTVTIAGSNFGATQGTSTVTFGSTAATPSSWSATSIVVPVPTGATTGNVVVTVGGVASNASPFTVGSPAPLINSLTPASGAVGSSVTIGGSNFGAAQGTSTVTFNATVAAPTSWGAASIIVPVPGAATTGNVIVTVGGIASNALTFTVTPPSPNITTLTPASGSVGTSVTIAGTNFGATQGASTVTFNGIAGTPTTWNATSIVVSVPAGAITGNVVVTVGGIASNAVAFAVTAPPPTISSVSPATGPVGTLVTITGTNFGATQGSSTLTFNGTTASPTSWSATSIVAPVPVGTTTGNAVVTVGGIASNGSNFTVTAPVGITLIQHTSKDAGATSSSTLAFKSNNTAGNWIAVVIRAGKAGQVFTVTDSLTNTYRKAVQYNVTTDTPNGDTLGIFYAENILGGANTVTVADSIAGNTMRFAILEYAGVATVGSLDITATAQGTSASASSGSAVTTANGDLLVGGILTGNPSTFTAGAGFKIEETVPASPNTKLGVEDQIQSAAGSAATVATFTASDSWGAGLAAFKAAGGTGSTAPSISSLSPTSGVVGSSVTIAGANFGATQGTSSVTFNGAAATPTVWSATSISVPVPSAATSGNVVVTVGGVASNGVTFTVTVPAPSITTITPTSGLVGSAVTVAGANFGATQGTSTVKFNGTTATPTAWSATSITVPVPTGATTGNVVVTVGAAASNGVLFTVTVPAPAISTINPASGAIGAAVTINGANFGAAQGTSSVTFNGIAGTPTAWTASSISVPVPNGASTGNVVVTVGGVPSNAVTFTVTTPGPTIATLTPISGLVGSSVTIAGANFGATQGTSTVTFNGTSATPTSWSTTSIAVPVPAGATTGNVVVTVGAVASNGVAFTVTVPAPSITSLTPISGVVGTSVTVAGANFGATQGTSTVIFNGTAATPTSWSATNIVVPVPAAATTGNVVVTVGGVASNGISFAITQPAPGITSLTPTSGAIGTMVTIAGTNFGATQGTSSVTFNGVSSTPTAWSTSSISVPVPTGATSGNVVVTVGGVASNGLTFTVTASAGGIKLVQHASKDAGATTSTTLAFSANNTAGNWIAVVIRAGKSGQVFTVTDSHSNIYKQAVLFNMTLDAETNAIYYAENIAGGANTVTVSDTITAGTMRLAIMEYSGVALAGSLDAAIATEGTGTLPSSGNAITSWGGDLLLGEITTANPATFSAGTGYKIEDLVPASPNTKLILEDQIQTAPGTSSATATLAASDSWSALFAAFKAANGTPPPPISVAVTPAAASVAAIFGTQVFTAQLTNDSQGKGVTWALSGAGCTGTACGALSGTTTTSVTYSAPASIPTPATVTLTATSIADTTKSASATITVIQGPLTVAVSPKRGSITTSQTQQFAATVYNDPQNAGVTWSVDGSTGGNATTGTISTTGLFTPGAQAGLHTIAATSVTNAAVSASVTFAVTDIAGVLMHHNDAARTGQNLQEYALTPATVTPATFSQLFSCPVDGYVYAQPLYVANLLVGTVKRNVVFVATEHDSVYAFDADSPSCVQLWKVSFLGTGITTMPWGDTANPSVAGALATDDVFPEIGITSTPVIDPVAGTIYVEAKTKETVGSGCSTGSPCYVHRLHALNITTGTEKTNSPIVISAPNFVPLRHFNRPALFLANNTVYIAFGSHGDIPNWQGWLFGYDATTLAQKFAWPATTATAGTSNGGSFWGGGAGPAVDASGNLYLTTGNGAFNANTGGANYSDSVVKISPAGAVVDYFTPFDQATFNANDIDLGSAGVIVLPDAVGSTLHPHLALATGKVGLLYLLDQTNLGKFNSVTDQDVQEVLPVPPPNTTNFDGGIFGIPAYWNGNIYVTGVGDNLMKFSIANGAISATSLSNSTTLFPLRGAIPTVSANGTTNGIVWILNLTGWQTAAPAILEAYDATNLANRTYVSPSSGTGSAGAAVKFTVPTVANGKVYIGGQASISVFGLLPN
jgi:hypothetical protein